MITAIGNLGKYSGRLLLLLSRMAVKAIAIFTGPQPILTHLQSRDAMLVRRTMHPGGLCRLIRHEHIQGQTLVISPLDTAGIFESSCTRLPSHA